MKGIVFGVFDMLHEGHKHFLSHATALCDELVAVVARPEIVKVMKGKEPRQSLEERMQAIEEWDKSITARAGDERQGTWKAIMEEKPDVIFIGYDQKEIANELENFNIRIVQIPAHEPERFKSSLL